MEGKIYLYLIIIYWWAGNVKGQHNHSIYQAYITGNMVKWKFTIDSMETMQVKTDKDKLDLINYQYGYIAWCIDRKQTKDAEKYLAKAESLLNQLELKKYELSMVYAYRAAFIGFKIGISPYKAPFIGPESLNFARKSVITDPENAFGYVQLGNIAYYTPRMFGGNRNEAMQYYLKAVQIMEPLNPKGTENWNYLNLLATVINAYFDLEQYEQAKHYCSKTLSLEPRFRWVKNNLYPKVLKGLQNE